jgi:hypothetical protein
MRGRGCRRRSTNSCCRRQIFSATKDARVLKPAAIPHQPTEALAPPFSFFQKKRPPPLNRQEKTNGLEFLHPTGVEAIGDVHALVLGRWAKNQPRACSTTVSSAPGSSNRCVAPGTTESYFSQRSSAKAARLRLNTTSSPTTTISRVGALTADKAGPARSGGRRATDRCDAIALGGGHDQGRGRPCAGAEIANRRRRCLGILADPVRCRAQTPGQRPDVEDVGSVELPPRSTAGQSAGLPACQAGVRDPAVS